MKRPATIGGHTLPKTTGRCTLCGERISEPQEGAMRLIYPLYHEGAPRFRLCCSDDQACRQRRHDPWVTDGKKDEDTA